MEGILFGFVFSSPIRISMRPYLVIVYPKQKHNVFGSQTLSGYLVNPKMAIFQASIFGYSVRIGLQQMKAVHFRMRSPSENSVRIWVYACHGKQQAW